MRCEKLDVTLNSVLPALGGDENFDVNVSFLNGCDAMVLRYRWGAIEHIKFESFALPISSVWLLWAASKRLRACQQSTF